MKHLPSPVNYRLDINGLRAWAVLAVVLYHFKVFGVEGGFVGVDIFFVISGYLMTAIIIKGLQEERFSLVKFYMARVRRIVPVLIVVISTMLTLGWFWLNDSDYGNLAKESINSLGFIANVGYWRSSGYFDSISLEKWLLHTWSLGVEAQFYLLFPLLMIVLWRLSPKFQVITLVLILILCISLLLGIYFTTWKPNAAFYLLPMRGWELLAGGVVYLVARNNALSDAFMKPVFWAGIALIFSSIFFISSEDAWPGYLAVLPVLGTSLVIFANQSNVTLLESSFVQWIGERSYSLYLWHWPLLVLLNFLDLMDDSLSVYSALFFSFILAHFSYVLIEVPTRKHLANKTFIKEILVVISAFLLVISFAFIIKNHNFPNRVDVVDLTKLDGNGYYPKDKICIDRADTNNDSPPCNIGKGKKVILFGDSHAGASFTALGASAVKHYQGAELWGKHDCRIIELIESSVSGPRAESCHAFNSKSVDKLWSYRDIKLVIINRENYKRWLSLKNIPASKATESDERLFFDDYTENICDLSEKLSGTLYLVKPFPRFDFSVPHRMSRFLLLKGDVPEIKIEYDSYLKKNRVDILAQEKAMESCGVKVLDPTVHLCDGKYCYGSKDGRPLYSDDDHLNEFGNKLLIPMFDQVFKTNKAN